jgi:hypothetical protein
VSSQPATASLAPEGEVARIDLLESSWRFQLALFANVVADEFFAGAAALHRNPSVPTRSGGMAIFTQLVTAPTWRTFLME